MKTTFSLLLLIVFSGCASVGEPGPELMLGDQPTFLLRHYFHVNSAGGAFAVTQDGQGAYYVFCQDPISIGCREWEMEQTAVRRCQSNWAAPCVLLLKRAQVVYNGPVRVLDGTYEPGDFIPRPG